MNSDFIPYTGVSHETNELQSRAASHYRFMHARRTVRDFSSKEIPSDVLKNILRIASTAPSGANKQPWFFCVVTQMDLKKKIQAAAEEEEYKSYHGRMPEAWLNDLKHLGTNWEKPFLQIAPALIVVFKKSYDLVNGERAHNYYVNESVGLACGFLLQAIHHCGLVALTHTPSPMNFLSEILNRPENEKPFLLIPVGYPAEQATVPNIERKGDEAIFEFYE